MSINNSINAPIPFSMSNGGTGANLTASIGAIPYSNSSTFSLLANPLVANKFFLSGNSSAPTWSTPTYPAASGSNGKIIRSDGTNNSYTTSTFPNTVSANSILYASSANVIGAIASANNGILTTMGGSNVPQLSASTINVTYNAANFTASTGTWTVDVGDIDYFYYQQIGRFMYIWFSFRTTSVSNAGVSLRFIIPNSVTVKKGYEIPIIVTTDNVTWTVADARGIAGDNIVRLNAVPRGTSGWPIATNTVGMIGSIKFEF